MEFMIIIKAYILLAGAILHGETITYAGEDFFEALCYLDGTKVQECINYRNEGFTQGMFPMNMTE